MITAAMPVTLSHAERDSQNAELTGLLVESLNHFLQFDMSLTIMAPQPEISTIAAALPSPGKVRVEFLPQEEIFPGLMTMDCTGWWMGAHNGPGWRRQQLWKLWAVSKADDFVLVLDPDMIASAPITEESLVKDGQANTTWMPKYRNGKWFFGSCELLRYRNFDQKRKSVSWLPAVMHPEIVRGLFDRLEATEEAKSLTRLMHFPREWTEVGLYSLYAEASGLLDKYHARRSDTRLVGFAATHPKDLPFKPGGGLFSICQSRLMVPAETVRSAYEALCQG
jgi:Family of unknown function (DUF6492)